MCCEAIITKRAVAWVGSVQPECTVPLSTWSFRNCKPEFCWMESAHCPQGLFSPFFTFLRAIFFCPFRLSLAPTICPWVSEDGFVKGHGCNGRGNLVSKIFLIEKKKICCHQMIRVKQMSSAIFEVILRALYIPPPFFAGRSLTEIGPSS